MHYDSSNAHTRQIRPAVLAILAIAGLFLVFILIIAGAWIGSRNRLRAEIAKLRSSGEPISADDMEAFYAAPAAGRDTTQLWLTALEPLDSPQFKVDAKDLPFVGEAKTSIPLPGEPWPQLAAAEAFLLKHRMSLDAMRQAARQGGRARFPTRFADGVSMLLPHAQKLRAGARLLALQTAVHAHRGQSDAAVESVVAMFAAARSLEQEPVVVSQLVRIALNGMAHAEVRWLLSAAVLNEPQLLKLDAELAAGEYPQAMRRALVGERAIGIQIFANPSSLGADALQGPPGLTPSSDQTMYLQIMGATIAAMGNAGPARQQALDQVQQELKELAAVKGASVRYTMTLLLAPAFDACGQAVSRAEASRDATRMALAIERFRQEQGRLPTKLEELTPKYASSLPIDPFDGAPLRYRADANGYLVYSVGGNGVDDGGADSESGQPLDVVVRVRHNEPAASGAGK